MKMLVTAPLSVEECNSMANALNNVLAVLQPRSVPLDLVTRQERRKMGTARQGYANMILPIALNNVNELPRDKDPRRLASLIDSFKAIAVVRGLAQKILELVDDTMMATGMDAVAETDLYAAILQVARRDNDGLDGEMGEVDAYNKRFGRQMDTEDQEEPVAPTGDAPTA